VSCEGRSAKNVKIVIIMQKREEKKQQTNMTRNQERRRETYTSNLTLFWCDVLTSVTNGRVGREHTKRGHKVTHKGEEENEVRG